MASDDRTEQFDDLTVTGDAADDDPLTVTGDGTTYARIDTPTGENGGVKIAEAGTPKWYLFHNAGGPNFRIWNDVLGGFLCQFDNATNTAYWRCPTISHAGTGGSVEFELRPSGAATLDLNPQGAYDGGIHFRENGTQRFMFRYEPAIDNLNLVNNTAGEDVLSVADADSTVSFHGNTTEGVVWQSGGTSSRPGSPVEGQRYFDSDLGQPIWYDGSGWVDATGSSV